MTQKIITIKDREVRAAVSEYLSSFLTEERNNRMLEILNNRTRYLTIVIEDLYQTQNISAVLRSCECVGIQDVHIVEGENSFEIHKAIAMGADKWLTQKYFPAVSGNMATCINQLKKQGYTVVATLPNENSCLMDELPIDKPVALLFGTELTGLSEEAIRLSDKCVKIPMYGFTTSYNISNSVAILVSFLIEKIRKSDIRWQLSDDEKEELYFEWLQKSLKTPELLIKKFLEEKNEAI